MTGENEWVTYERNGRAVAWCPADDAGEFRGVVLNGREIDRLLRAGAITQPQNEAAERLYTDWWNSSVGGSGASWREWRGGVPLSTVEKMDAHQEASWRAYRAALEAIPIYWPRSITTAVVLFDVQCKNLVALRVGLDVLVKHYR